MLYDIMSNLEGLFLIARPIGRNVSEDFCCEKLEDFAGDFPGEFFWALPPPPPKKKKEKKNPARKSAKKSGGSKIKIREKSFCRKPALILNEYVSGYLR